MALRLIEKPTTATLLAKRRATIHRTMTALVMVTTVVSASCSVSIQIGQKSEELDETDFDENARSFVEDAIVSIFSPPSSAALVSRVAPEVAEIENMEEFFDNLTQKTGALVDYEITDVSVADGDLFGTGDTIRVARYKVDATFENGPGNIELDIIKRGGELQITRWFIGGPVIAQ